MSNCDSCGKKPGWRKHHQDLYEYISWVKRVGEDTQGLTKFDTPLPPKESWPVGLKYCGKCMNNFFIPYAGQLGWAMKQGLSDKKYTEWSKDPETGADVYKQAVIIDTKIQKEIEKLEARRLETMYKTHVSELYKFEKEFLTYEVLEMKYDSRYYKVKRLLQEYSENPLYMDATVGPERLLAKYELSKKLDKLKETKPAETAKPKGALPKGFETKE